MATSYPRRPDRQTFLWPFSPVPLGRPKGERVPSMSLGGLAFAYRLTAAPASQPDFKLTLAAAHYNVTRDPEGGLEDNRAEIERLEKRIPEIDAEVSAAKAVQKTDPTAAARIRELTTEKRTATATVRKLKACLLYTSPSPRDATLSRMPSSA